MKAFSERNPIVVGVAGLLVVAAVGTATYYADDLPLIGGGTHYSADFRDAAQLRSGDDVRVAGVKVGTVSSIDLVGDRVRVDFKVKNAWIGDESTIAVKIKTLLGQEFLDIAPAGDAAQRPGSTIPVGRTSTPVDVQEALSQLSGTIGAVDTTRLSTAFNTLSKAFQDTPDTVRGALTGLSRLSVTIASRDAELRELVQRAHSVTGIVAENNSRISGLINDGVLLLRELQRRSDAITALLQGTRDFARELTGLVTDNDKTIGPALTALGKVTDTLTANRANLDQTLSLLKPYFTTLTDAAGNGPWLDVYICGLFNRQTPVLDAHALRDCSPGDS